MRIPRLTTVLLDPRSFRLAEWILGLLPAFLLAPLASLLAQPRPLGRFPGWRFGIEEDTPTVLMCARRWVWDYFKKTGRELPVRITWLEGIRLDLVLGNDQSRCLYVGSSIEPNELAFVAQVLRSGMTVVDAGANEGLYTVLMAKCVGPEGLVIAVEPSPRERGRLARNVSINGLRNVRIVSEGLAAQAGRALLHVAEPEHSGQNTLGGFIYAGVRKAGDVEVGLQPLDSVVAGFGGRRIDLIKMDVEGAELQVLRGAERILGESRPVILFELLDEALRAQSSSARELLDLLAAAGYEVLGFDASGAPAPLSACANSNGNFIALPKDGPRARELRRLFPALQ